MSEVIKDLNGWTLRLSKTKLVELTGERLAGQRWALPLSELKTDAFNVAILCIAGTLLGEEGRAIVDKEGHRIGCREFSRTTFNKIMKAARALNKKPKVKV